MPDILDTVDPFHGNFGTTVVKAPLNTPAAGWQWLKALPGNTHPGACWPFGVMSACAYTGGYPTGYSPYQQNYDSRLNVLPGKRTALGITHIHPSGIGATGRYHNYLLVTPFIGETLLPWQAWSLRNEQARPGWYAAEFGRRGASVESTVTHHAAWHRAYFPVEKPGCLCVDLLFSYAGDERFVHTGVRRNAERPDGSLIHPRQSDSADVEIVDSRILLATVRLEGRLTMYVCLAVRSLGGGRWYHADGNATTRLDSGPAERIVFRANKFSPIELKIGLSFHSTQQARAFLQNEMPHWDFDRRLRKTQAVWRDYLQRIEIQTDDTARCTIFYTSLYRCLLKPMDFTGDSPFWSGRKSCWLEFATLWDQYKTLLPLLMLFWPRQGAAMVNSLLNLTAYRDELQNAYLIEPKLDSTFNDQGFGLAIPAIAQAAVMGLPGIQWTRALRVLSNAMSKVTPPAGKRGIDYAIAAFGLSQIAHRAGDEKAQRRWIRAANHWRKQYTVPAGKIGPGPFYEGQSWTYSFAVWHNLEGMADVHGGKANLLADLDCFFHLPGATLRNIHRRAFHAEQLPVDQRFEGLNNEPDMEIPYLYMLLGRPDRTADLVRCILDHRFTTGRGGLPGNDDSGGLSSWYVWSALGLFPVVDQNRFLINVPLFREAILHIGRSSLRIRAKQVSKTNRYIQSIFLNGHPLQQPWINYQNLKGGGDLQLEMHRICSGNRSLVVGQGGRGLTLKFDN